MQTLGMPVSDHVPYVIVIGTSIPRANLFRFEAEFSDFLPTVELHWNSSPYFANAAQTLSAKFKQVRAGLRK